ncbi:hypothetical protein PGT21_014541 [Puccinia graminis f. sp. tritici]|uniref:Secreted protein n=1 Tax=Puccinia graminis f. sp. tritici TaxID=56615 RepID=A0A5B0LXA3_PUCGR|nr:hypothetical protein PGTUg99_036687 [Puccinia graminis f. sp. tritici]KAA1075667.1 hypothetical protein PGTUg99_034231 [Puccinia graminis f. sp. tritici]KAA1104196.1 hypothetical protein PGT21_014541 [Puccinia graminis f. sp. tritici]
MKIEFSGLTVHLVFATFLPFRLTVTHTIQNYVFDSVEGNFPKIVISDIHASFTITGKAGETSPNALADEST